MSICSLCFAFTLAIYTYVGLLCGSGYNYICNYIICIRYDMPMSAISDL